MSLTKIKTSRAIIKKCETLEKDLSKYPLRANLIPKENFYKNLRYFLSKPAWKIISRAVKKRYNYKCSICARENIRLDTHENWKYDYISNRI